jgi:uncharacterized protein with FMN-binding domain
MRKSLLIITSVAILGGLGLFFSKNKDQPAMAENTNAATNSSGTANSSTANAVPATTYKDGTYIGSKADTIYGTVQVSAIISGGKISDIQFIQMPNDQENSKVVAAAAEPQLKAEAINKQSAHIDFVSGATQDSMGFEQSLQAALDQAAQS